MSDKPNRPKPQFYALVFSQLQEIARLHGYNLVLHGSLNRDLDLIAVPWVSKVSPPMDVIHSFCSFLGTPRMSNPEDYLFSEREGGRASYIINLNRGGKRYGYADPQWYIDISFTPTNENHIAEIEQLKEALSSTKAWIVTMNQNGRIENGDFETLMKSISITKTDNP